MIMQDNISETDKEKITQALESIRAQFDSSSLHRTIAENHAKLIDCRHEIVISVMAHVIEEDDIGQTIGSKEICKKNYHIPVPSNRDYHEYLDGFFKFFENCMSSSAQQQSPVKENTDG